MSLKADELLKMGIALPDTPKPKPPPGGWKRKGAKKASAKKTAAKRVKG